MHRCHCSRRQNSLVTGGCNIHARSQSANGCGEATVGGATRSHDRRERRSARARRTHACSTLRHSLGLPLPSSTSSAGGSAQGSTGRPAAHFHHVHSMTVKAATSKGPQRSCSLSSLGGRQSQPQMGRAEDCESQVSAQLPRDALPAKKSLPYAMLLGKRRLRTATAAKCCLASGMPDRQTLALCQDPLVRSGQQEQRSPPRVQR